MSRFRVAALIGLLSGLLLAGCDAGPSAASPGSAPAVSGTDPLGGVEATLDAIERDLDADAG